MKKVLSAIFSIIFVLTASMYANAYTGECSAKAAILYQPETDTVLYDKNIYEPCLIASTTKILTALITIENAEADEIVEIRPEYTGIEGSSMYLKSGERFTVKELLYGLLLISGNDVAVALACHVAGSVDAFAELMNKRAKELGCVMSNFANPHGLDTENHYSCAYDLAIITATAMKNELFAEISGTKTIEFAGRCLTNHNKLLWTCDGVNGGKTGYTTAAGRILVSSCERDGMNLICVTVSDKNDWQDHISLYDWGYDNYKLLSIGRSFEIPVISGNKSTVTALCDDERLIVKSDDDVEIVYNIPRFIYAPVNAEEKIGTVQCTSDNFAAEYNVILTESVGNDTSIPLSFWEKLKWTWYYYNWHNGVIPYLH